MNLPSSTIAGSKLNNLSSSAWANGTSVPQESVRLPKLKIDPFVTAIFYDVVTIYSFKVYHRFTDPDKYQ